MVTEEKISRMKTFIAIIRTADTAYYRDDTPIMTDREYDKLVNELAAALRYSVAYVLFFGDFSTRQAAVVRELYAEKRTVRAVAIVSVWHKNFLVA